MSKILYPRPYIGNPMGKIFLDRYEYGMVLLYGYVLVAIPSCNPYQSLHPNADKTRRRRG
jgi:hypothetical protein